MKKFLKKIWEAVKVVYEKLVGTTQKLVPVAINVVEGIKKVMDSPVDDIILGIIAAAIPGDADDKLIEKISLTVQKWIPKILLELKLVDSIAHITDPNEQLKAILAQLKLSSSETQNIIYHGMASLILEKLSDGKISWTDAVAISEYYYTNFTAGKTVEL
jgi:hypothetical protein